MNVLLFARHSESFELWSKLKQFTCLGIYKIRDARNATNIHVLWLAAGSTASLLFSVWAFKLSAAAQLPDKRFHFVAHTPRCMLNVYIALATDVPINKIITMHPAMEEDQIVEKR